MAPGVELRNRKLGDRTRSDKQTCQQAKKPTTSSRESDKNKSLLPKVTTKTPTDLNAKSRVFVRDVVEFLYEKVFLNGEDTLKLEESSDEKNATSTMIKNTGGQLLVHDDDASKNAAQWLQALLPPDGAGGGESECEQAEDRKAYAKRVQSRSKQQLYVDWVRAVLDSRYGAGWHVLFGRDMGFAMRYRKGSLGMFSIGDKVRVIVYKSGPKGTALHNNRLLATRPPEVKAAATTTGDAGGKSSSPTVPPKVQVVDWYGYCDEEWEGDADAKNDVLAAESSDAVPAADLQKQDLERKERRAKILAYAKAKDRFEPCIAALTSAVAFWDEDSAKFARSVRYRLTKQTIMDSIDVAGAASSTSSSTSPSGSAAAGVPEPQPEAAASSASAAAPARTSSSSTSEDSRDPLLPCRPDPDCSWHCYTGSDFVASTAVTVQNQITALLKKRRVLVFQHCSPDDVVRFSPLQIAREVVSDGQIFMKVLPYLALFFVGVWYFGRRILCMDHAGAAAAASFISTSGQGGDRDHDHAGDHHQHAGDMITPPSAHAVDAEELVRQTFGNRRYLIKPSAREWIGDGGAGSLDSVFCEVDLENSGALTYVAGFFLAMMVARNVSGKLAKNATGGPGPAKRR